MSVTNNNNANLSISRDSDKDMQIYQSFHNMHSYGNLASVQPKLESEKMPPKFIQQNKSKKNEVRPANEIVEAVVGSMAAIAGSDADPAQRQRAEIARGIVGNAAAFVERVRRGGAGGGAEAGDEAGAEAGAEVVQLGGALLAGFDGMVRKGVERVMSCSNRLVRMTLCEFPYAECSLPAAWVYFIASYVPLPTSHFPQLESIKSMFL